ncbi:MAG: acyl transferase [Bacteroidia bacterium]|nr:acyl transferase [Bacteroidia bacterium]NNF32102.1 acyl transferase [Flavobacteriaceae bacterium]MBT8275141.1 acyl transferase [Bacteroidia bacterium]NNJ82248.1 acyl transferase [Flavobacteriaceae bacterium]NNK54966.1 acyl transferase [Flavobacteriaceae bacterium]
MSLTSIFNIDTPEEFRKLALETFLYQYNNVPVYRKFCETLGTEIDSIDSITGIPFMPIQFFKSEKVISNGHSAQMVFHSSGTTGSNTSKHFVADIELYEKSFTRTFEDNFGNPQDLAILALLPSYLERQGSSLVYMVDSLLKASRNPRSGFYLKDTESLTRMLQELEETGQKTLLIGVSFALLDLVEDQKFQLKNTIVMETGGMKGRRREMIREELHEKLKTGFGVSRIYSEYGMTELLSQAYSKGDGIFQCPPWMKILTRDTEDALSYVHNKTGGLNIIDLANRYSCSFIATQDLGKCYPDGSFEIIGRFDTSDIRGCNLMVL